MDDTPYGTSQWVEYYQVKYACGYGTNTYKNEYGQIKDIPKIGDMLICTQNGYVYKVAGFNEAAKRIAVWYVAGAKTDQTFDPTSEKAQSGMALAPQFDILNTRISNSYEQLFNLFGFSEGTSGNWTYRKWNNGRIECWSTVSHNFGNMSATGALYNEVLSISLPDGMFKTTPSYAFGNLDLVGSVNVVLWRSTNSTLSVNVNTAISWGSDNYCTISLYVVGKWK